MPGPGRGLDGLEMTAELSPCLERPAEEEGRVTEGAVCTQTTGLWGEACVKAVRWGGGPGTADCPWVPTPRGPTVFTLWMREGAELSQGPTRSLNLIRAQNPVLIQETDFASWEVLGSRQKLQRGRTWKVQGAVWLGWEGPYVQGPGAG